MDSAPSVTRRLALARDLDETLAYALPETVAAVDEFLSPVLQPGETSTVSKSLDLYRRKLAWAGENLSAADHKYLAGTARTACLCARRDRLAMILSKKLASLYRTCRGWLSPDDLRLLGFTSETARWPKPVLKQSREVATGLERLDVELESVEWPRMKTWLQEQARDLRPELGELSRTLQAIEQQRRQTKADAAVRREASEEFNQNYLAIGRVAEALLRMAGKDAEADRIHPTTRQLDRKADDDECDGPHLRRPPGASGETARHER